MAGLAVFALPSPITVNVEKVQVAVPGSKGRYRAAALVEDHAAIVAAPAQVIEPLAIKEANLDGERYPEQRPMRRAVEIVTGLAPALREGGMHRVGVSPTIAGSLVTGVAELRRAAEPP